MAWTPTTQFERDMLELQPDFNFIQGQLAYEAENRVKREELKENHDSKTKAISESLEMMERIQQIAGTKSLGQPATMADWDDTSTVEQEAIAMMRHFGMMSMADGSLQTSKEDDEVLLPKTKVHMIRNGRRVFPFIVDPNYFEPGRMRKTENTNASNASSGCNELTNPKVPTKDLTESSGSVKSYQNDAKDKETASIDNSNDSVTELVKKSTSKQNNGQPKKKPKHNKHRNYF